jgi:hypothetical protein
MIRLFIAFILMYGTVGGIETNMYYTWLQPAALFALSGLTFLTTVMDGTWQRITRSSR